MIGVLDPDSHVTEKVGDEDVRGIRISRFGAFVDFFSAKASALLYGTFY